jgi:hypothetical protein
LNPNDPPSWLVANEMIHARRNHNLVVLPDGKVLAVGGNAVNNVNGAVRAAEIFDPSAGTWTEQPESHADHPRMYHSSAMLLPDGRVVSAGGNNHPTAQIFRPPYFNISGDPRPTIDSAPAEMHYNQSYTINYHFDFDGPVASHACLIRVSHAWVRPRPASRSAGCHQCNDIQSHGNRARGWPDRPAGLLHALHSA